MILSKKYFFCVCIATLIFATSCKDDDLPVAENEEEVINEVTLTFEPTSTIKGVSTVSFTYKDADGQGVGDTVPTTISLKANTSYRLSIKLENTLETPSKNITDEIKEAANEHQFFFSWTGDVFKNPTGNGNIDTASDPLRYDDKDDNGLPLGLSTLWETSETPTSKDEAFRIVLKHQPNIKTATSSSNDGESDINIDWIIRIVE